jgi:hypothetical protein
VYFLEEDEHEAAGKEAAAEEQVAEKKEKKRTTIKLTRVEIDFSDSDSEDEEGAKLGGELGEEVDAAVRRVSSEMAADRLAMKNINIVESDDEEDEDEPVVEVVSSGKKEEASAVVQPIAAAALSAFLQILLPLCGDAAMKDGVDKITDENEQDAAGMLDGVLRLAAVLDPAVFVAAAKAESEKVRCNLFDQLVDHGELIQMLSR